MNEMPLQTQRRVMTWLCVTFRLADKMPTQKQKMRYKIISTILVVAMTTGFFSSFAYLLKMMSVDLGESLYAIFQIAACAAITYEIISAYYFKRQLTEAVFNLSKIYDSSEFFSILF